MVLFFDKQFEKTDLIDGCFKLFRDFFIDKNNLEYNHIISRQSVGYIT